MESQNFRGWGVASSEIAVLQSCSYYYDETPRAMETSKGPVDESC